MLRVFKEDTSSATRSKDAVIDEHEVEVSRRLGSNEPRALVVGAAHAMAQKRTPGPAFATRSTRDSKSKQARSSEARPAFRAHGCPVRASSSRRTSVCRRESSMCGLGRGSLSCVSQRTRRRRLRIQDSALRLYGWGSSAPSIAKIDQKPPGGAGSKQVARPSRAFGQHHYQRGGQVRE